MKFCLEVEALEVLQLSLPKVQNEHAIPYGSEKSRHLIKKISIEQFLSTVANEMAEA